MRKDLFPRAGSGPGLRETSGQAIVEFLFCLITFLFVFLGTLQLALCLNAYSIVRYAAFNAARSAIVHGANHGKMLEAARVSLLGIFPRHGRASTVRGMTENYLSSLAVDQSRYWQGLSGKAITEVSLIPAHGVRVGEVVSFDDPKSAEKGVVTVRVEHQYELVVPLANAIIYKILHMVSDGDTKARTLDDVARLAAEDKKHEDPWRDSGYRIPLVAYYTMRMQSDYRWGR